MIAFYKNYDIISYSSYGKKLAENYIADFKFKSNLSMVRKKIHMKKIGKIQNKLLKALDLNTKILTDENWKICCEWAIKKIKKNES